MLSLVVFFLGLGSIGAITSLAVAQLFVSNFEFWPPPSTESWQHLAFRTLFRAFFVCLIVLSVLVFEPQELWRYIFGGGLLAIGFGLALRWTGYLGWDNAFGDDTGLKTKGPFLFSRNPIYVASIIGMLGWALLANSIMVGILLALWAAIYLVAPIVEESGMRSRYGDQFAGYSSAVPRYLALRPVLRAALAAAELKVPPLLITLACAGIIYWLAEAIHHEELLTLPYRVVLASAPLTLALGILFAALRAFNFHKTTVNPLVPDNASSVVTTSIYKYTRNPMYLSMSFLLWGWVILLGQASALAAMPIYFILITYLQIIPEEKILARRFSDEYDRYCTKTSRWVNL